MQIQMNWVLYACDLAQSLKNSEYSHEKRCDIFFAKQRGRSKWLEEQR